MVSHKILIVDDDYRLGSTLKDFFETYGFDVIVVTSGEEAIVAFKEENPSVILLDVRLPSIDGFEVIEKIYMIDNHVPVIMMTGTEYNETNRIKGYELRAIHFIKKPVSPDVILARIKLLLNPPKTERFYLGGYTITIQDWEVMIKNEKYKVLKTEADVLSVLLRNKNKIVTRREILLSVWKEDEVVKNPLLDTSILKIRRILKKYPEIKIERSYGIGYMITDKKAQ